MRMAGMEAGDPEVEETDADGEDIFYRRRPVGAINPLLAAEDEGTHTFVHWLAELGYLVAIGRKKKQKQTNKQTKKNKQNSEVFNQSIRLTS